VSRVTRDELFALLAGAFVTLSLPLERDASSCSRVSCAGVTLSGQRNHLIDDVVWLDNLGLKALVYTRQYYNTVL
jgi:hypothetical protein